MPEHLMLDPEDRKGRWKAHRARFLRNLHKKPLRKRLEEVLGPYADDAISLAKKRLSDPWIRDKLRAMVRTIPEEDHHRRWCYFVRCCEEEGVFGESKAKAMEAAEEAERVLDQMDEDDRREVGKAEIRHLHRTASGPRDSTFADLKQLVGDRLAAEVFSLIFDPYYERALKTEVDPDDANRAFAKVCNLACRARNPTRYVKAIIRNVSAKMAVRGHKKGPRSRMSA